MPLAIPIPSTPTTGPVAPSSVPRRIDLVVAGARGQVGACLRRQLARRQTWLRDREGLDLRVIAAFDTRGLDQDPGGVASEACLPPRQPGDVTRLLQALRARTGTARLFVDCTASEDVADTYPDLLGAGIGVVAANKRANARSLAHYLRLQSLSRDARAPYRYETTVGAAIPVLGTIRDLHLRGERIQSLQGVLSGSLSHVLHRIHDGLAFSAAVAEARALGLTEPDPLEDLAARDLSRKLLVLAREAGFPLEAEQVRVLALCSPRPGEPLESALAGADARWRRRVLHAEARGCRLVAVAEADASGGRIGVKALPADSPLARLGPGENRVLVRSQWQSSTPLVLGGPGAGAEVTAAGLLSDIIHAARELAAVAD